jgi:carboxymethylenebutenolidase
LNGKFIMRALLSLFLFTFLIPLSFAHDPGQEAADRWWWSDAWWEQGKIETANNLDVTTSWVTYMDGNLEVRALLARPKKRGRYPGVLFVHGRRGLDELVQKKVKRLAARGLVVLAPDVFDAHDMDAYPYGHNYALEETVNQGVDALLKVPGLSGKKVCLVSHTRGGYYSLKVAVSKERQIRDVACYVSWYPHMQDPNAPEPSQVYGYAPEADELKIPTLIFIGEHEQYQRRRPIESAVKQLKEMGRDVTLVIYPGVGRAFDFRPPNVRTFADDLAAKDANRRAAEFVYRHLGRK